MNQADRDWVRAMREEWDERGRRHARHYIATGVPDTEEAFYASGRTDYEAHVLGFLRANRFSPAGKTALEIGCGIGRMTRTFADEFADVIGVDVSEEMIDRARAGELRNVRFVVGSGGDLAGIADLSVDFAFSYIVFQHIPLREVTLNYLEEIGRVLRKGGLFLVHLNGLPYVRVQAAVWEGYVSRSPILRKVGLKKLPFVRRRRLGTWLGHPVNLGEARRACQRAGLRVSHVDGRWTENMWLGGRKEV